VGYDLYTGVPCSFLTPLINQVIDAESIEYVPLNNEGEAVAYGCGAFMAGRSPVVMFQNSGLGNAVNPLASLAVPFQLPILLVVTWRGEPGIGDEPQHEIMGRTTGEILKLMQVESEIIDEGKQGVHDQLLRARDWQRDYSLPFGLVMRKRTVEPYDLKTPIVSRNAPDSTGCGPEETGKPELKRFDCVRIVADVVGVTHVIIATTGKTGRELFTYRDSANHLYVVGSMGCASSLGLGLARHLPKDKKVVVIDGDGAALMRLEAMASVGHYRPENMVHLVLDNNAHDSTGGQQTLSDTVSFPTIAAAVGYRHSRSICTGEALSLELEAALRRPAPTLLHVRVAPGSLEPLGRPSVPPAQVARRLMDHLGVA